MYVGIGIGDDRWWVYIAQAFIQATQAHSAWISFCGVGTVSERVGFDIRPDTKQVIPGTIFTSYVGQSTVATH